jgi:L-2-hydroxyglutarate oxidase LhgO
MLYELCEKNGIPYRKTGKLIVASDIGEEADLEHLYEWGKNNGVTGLQFLTRRETAKMEPHITALAALYSPETGIIDSHRLMQYFLDDAKNSGALVSFNSEVIAIRRISDGYEVTIKNNGEMLDLKSRVLVNCAGLESDHIAQIAGIDIGKHKYQLHYCRGRYFRVSGSKSGLIKTLVYPVPKPRSGGLGIHATVDLAGGVRLGPDDEYLEGRQKDYSVDESLKGVFYDSARKFMPFLEIQDLSADTAGIRPKLQERGGSFRDFIIREEGDKGLPGFINLIGIESPGLTASPAIARYVKNFIQTGGHI